jgi:hypothetical protein
MLTSCKFLVMFAQPLHPALKIEQIPKAKRVFAVKLPGFALNGSEVFAWSNGRHALVACDLFSHG